MQIYARDELEMINNSFITLGSKQSKTLCLLNLGFIKAIDL